MLPSTPSLSDRPYVWTTTRRWLEWATLAIYVAAGAWLFALGGHAILMWVCGVIYLVLVVSFRRHRVGGTDEGIELRTVWWRKLMPWHEVTSVETRPKHGPNAVLLSKRLDPPWYLVISSGRRRYVVESRRSLAETMRADFERLRATHLEQGAPFAKS